MASSTNTIPRSEFDASDAQDVYSEHSHYTLAEESSTTASSTTSLTTNSSSLDEADQSWSQTKVNIHTDHANAKLDAWGLPLRVRRPPHVLVEPWPCRALQPFPRFDLLRPGERVAIDGEFQRYKEPGDVTWRRRWGQLAVTGEEDQVVMDTYVIYDNVKGTVKAYDPWEFSVRPEDLRYKNGGRNGRDVEKDLRKIVDGRTIVFHSCGNDMVANFYEKDMFASHQYGVTLFDTQRLYYCVKPSRDGPSLSHCVSEVLKKSMRTEVHPQSGIIEHNPVEDARKTMQLFLLKMPSELKPTPIKEEVRPKRQGRGRSRQTLELDSKAYGKFRKPRADHRKNLDDAASQATTATLASRPNVQTGRGSKNKGLAIEDETAFPKL